MEEGLAHKVTKARRREVFAQSAAIAQPRVATRTETFFLRVFVSLCEKIALPADALGSGELVDFGEQSALGRRATGAIVARDSEGRSGLHLDLGPAAREGAAVGSHVDGRAVIVAVNRGGSRRYRQCSPSRIPAYRCHLRRFFLPASHFPSWAEKTCTDHPACRSAYSASHLP